MTDLALKKRIAVVYKTTTQISIVAAAASIVLSLSLKYISPESKADYYLSYAAVLLLIATPFVGVVMAVAHYIAEKNRKMTAYAVIILIILVTGIFLKKL